MKKLLAVIAALLVLGAVVPGCRHAVRYDVRLAAADSLMRDFPDSALAMLEALPIGDLHTGRDSAYRDLLLTQARYKAYVTATSDSDINRALAWFRAHPADREKLTRAYIYKGAVMDELGHPDSAMLYYKHAEATAAPDDYFNLGYAKMRIAELYQGQISQDSIAISSAQDAIHYFSLINDTNYLIVSYCMLGAIYGMVYPDSSEANLINAINLAKSFDPSMQYTPMSKLAGLYLYHKKDFKACNDLAMTVFKNGRDDCAEDQFYYYLVLSYFEMGLLDSAKYVMSYIPKPESKTDSMNYYSALALLSNNDKNYQAFARHISTSQELKADIIYQTRTQDLTKIYKEFENQKEKQISNDLKANNKVLFVLLGILLLLSLFAVKKFFRYYRNNKTKQLELVETRKNLEAELLKLQRELEEKNNNENVSLIVGYRLAALKELFNLVRVKTDDANRKRKIIPISSLLKSMNERKQIMETKLPDSFWEKIKLSIDGEFKGLATFVEHKYTCLSKLELRMFNLLAAGISPQIIMVCMNFSSAGSVSNYKKRILKEKMGFDVKFEEFIRMYLNGEIQ